MTKQEKIANLEFQLERERERRVKLITRDVTPPDCGPSLARGWDFWVHRGEWRVGKACSSCTSHGDGWEKTTSQNSRALFSTELRATLAARQALINEHIDALAKIDNRITTLLDSVGADGAPGGVL